MSMSEIKKHKSYGMIDISRTQGKDRILFGSSIKHHNTIRIRISPGELKRHLNTDWYHAIGIPYIEVELSQTQFAEAITNMNTGGTPCTIKQVGGEYVGECDYENKKEIIENEFLGHINKLYEKMDRLTENAEKILKGSKAPRKGEKQDILNAISNLKMEVNSNLPFIEKMFKEQMEKTIHEAKGEIEAYWMKKIHDLGLEGLDKEKIKLLGEKE